MPKDTMVFYRLRTAHGSVVSKVDQKIVCSQEGADGSLPVFVYEPAGSQQVCFIMLGLKDILPLGILRTNGAILLYNPRNGLWASASPMIGQPPTGSFSVDREKVAEWEKFSLLPLADFNVPPAIKNLARRIEWALSKKLSTDLLRSMADDEASVLEAIGCLSSRQQIAAFVQSVVNSPSDMTKFLHLYPKRGRAFFDLSNWLSDREKDRGPPRLFLPTKQKHRWRAPEILGQDMDGFGTPGNAKNSFSFPQRCNAIAREIVEPRRDLCIIAAARNEGAYILEWLAYHRAIGFQQFFLYTNDNTDGSDELLAHLEAAREVRWIRNEVQTGASAQIKAYGHALGFNPEVLDYRWALIIDLDEFFGFDEALFSNALDFVRWQETRPVDAIALNWMFHGPAGEAQWRDEFIARRFPHAVGGPDHHIKTMCRPGRFVHSLAHHPLRALDESYTFRAEDGRIHVPHSDLGLSGSKIPSANCAWINHYFHKSSEEFLLKWSRNRGDCPRVEQPTNEILPATFVHDFHRHSQWRAPPRVTLDQCAPTFDAELARLKACPGVAAAWHNIKRIHTERIKTIVPMFVNAPGIVEAGENGKAFLATLGL